MVGHRVRSLAPLVHVADPLASAAFYESLGFEIVGRFTPPGAEAPAWLSLACEQGQLMLALADEMVIPDRQAILFYFYCADVAAMRDQAEVAGLSPGPIAFPFYNPEGEFRLVDPDGYVVMVAHL